MASPSPISPSLPKRHKSHAVTDALEPNLPYGLGPPSGIEPAATEVAGQGQDHKMINLEDGDMQKGINILEGKPDLQYMFEDYKMLYTSVEWMPSTLRYPDGQDSSSDLAGPFDL